LNVITVSASTILRLGSSHTDKVCTYTKIIFHVCRCVTLYLKVGVLRESLGHSEGPLNRVQGWGLVGLGHGDEVAQKLKDCS